MYSVETFQVGNIPFDIIKVKQQHLELTVTNYGCSILELNAKDKNGVFENVVMKYENIESLINNEMYLNAVVGPTAGRIKNGTYSIDGVDYQLDQNFFETENLHSGSECFSFKTFDYQVIDTKNETKIIFSYTKKEDASNYPGEVDLRVIYTINKHDFTIEYHANTTKDTLLNLTNHAYFNLSGNMKRTVLNHNVFINSSTVMELDHKNVPVGICSVEDTYLDFRQNKLLKEHYFNGIYETGTGGIDHPFLFDDVSFEKPNAILEDKESGRIMEVYTTYPSVVVYAHNFPDKEQLAYQKTTEKHLGICFETQNQPNGININNMESSILKPSEQYNHKTTYRFMVKEG